MIAMIGRIENGWRNHMKDIVYFELNNWMRGKDYPNEEPFITWLRNDLQIYFNNEDWIEKNKLCVVKTLIDMSQNFCVTATKEWVENNCPKLLTEYEQFLRYPDEDGYVYGQCGDEFMEYSEDNIGIRWSDYDDE